MDNVVDYTGPYDSATDPQYQLVTRVLALASLPVQVLTLADVQALALDIESQPLNWVQLGGANQLAGIGVLFGMVTFDVSRLLVPAQIAAIALIGGQSGDDLVSVAAVSPPVVVVPGMSTVTLPVTLVSVDSQG